jgi:hypothetical protein
MLFILHLVPIFAEHVPSSSSWSFRLQVTNCGRNHHAQRLVAELLIGWTSTFPDLLGTGWHFHAVYILGGFSFRLIL